MKDFDDDDDDDDDSHEMIRKIIFKIIDVLAKLLQNVTYTYHVVYLVIQFEAR